MSQASYQPGPRETGPVRDSGGSKGPSQATEGTEGFTEAMALKISRQAETNHQQVFSSRAGQWQRSYRAYRGEHFAKSKYLTKEYAERSKLFIPKTRASVHKNQTAAAAALFSTDDVVSIRPEHDDDDMQHASAAVIHQILNYRLDRTSPRGGIPWFQIAMGGHLDAQTTGIVVSKQDWEYEERQVGEEPVMAPLIDEMTGEPVLSPLSGEPILIESGEMQPVMRRIKDRPIVLPMPPENVIIDPAAPWYDPVQGAGYIKLLFPMSFGDVKQMLTGSERNPKSRIAWKQVSDEDLRSAAKAYDAAGVRRAREGRRDRLDQSAQTINDFSTVWVHENFVRHNGVDYNYWSVGSEVMLSKIAEVEDIYPAFSGDRPITYGYGAIEPHNPFPVSPVESWQPLQQEINDLRNLRLDAAKQSVLPFATVKSGKNIDVSGLTKLAPGSHIYVQDHEDVAFRDIPNGAGQAMAESQHLSVEFDELSGSFGGSSVQNNRNMNETVGGMRLLSGSANASTEFDLRVFVETWIEPTLRQLVRLIQFYENDATVLAIAKEKAELFTRYGIDEVTDDMLSSEVTVKVNVGIGAADPMQKLQKLGVGMEMLSGILPNAEPQIVVNSEEAVSEIMGAVGYSDGKRFFHWPDPNEPQEEETPPEVLMAQAEQEAETERANIKADTDREVATIKAKSDLERERLRGRGSLAETILNNQAHAADARSGRLTELFRGARAA